MSKSLLQIDVSKPKREEDLIKIRFKNGDVFQINFSKLVSQSKYIRDKYKYSEAINSIQREIDEVEQKFNINEESIKYFMQLIQEEKIDLPIEHYKNLYTLSEYFYVPIITDELDNINRKDLFKDLNFTIQFLHDYEKVNDSIETRLTIKIENFLRERINECIENEKFRELSMPTIYRIVEQCKEKIDQNLLVNFIFESASARFILLKLVKFDRLNDDKVNELIKFIDEQEETTKKMILEYMPFNLSFIKNIKYKYDQLFNEMNQTKLEFDQIKRELNQTKQELNESKVNHDQTKQELNRTKVNHDQTKQELNEIKINHERTKQELDECKREIMKYKKINTIDKKQKIQSIIVGGYDDYNQLGEKPNNNKNGYPIISPPFKLSLDPSSLLSYSIYYRHAVLVMSDGSLKGIGNNKTGRISSTLQKTSIKNFTDFCIKDGSNRQLTVISAVCYNYGTLYMFSKSSGNERQLVLCDEDINEGDPVFLDIGNHHPVSLSGGYNYSAAIGSEGEVIFINRYSVKNSPNSPIASFSLPDGEKASSAACCDDSVVVLSSNGRVFTSSTNSNGVLNFSAVSELSGQEIVCVSGTYEHCLAVNKEGRVFGRGSNGSGQLGLGKGTYSVSSFTEISSLAGYEIKAAYAGYYHSLFATREGKIFSCGRDKYGELLLSSDPGKNVCSPTESTITSGAAFCIAGHNISAVFIGSE